MESSAGGSAQIYFGRKYFCFKSVFDPSQTQKAEGSAGGSAQIYLGQKISWPQFGIKLFQTGKWKGLPEALPKFI